MVSNVKLTFNIHETGVTKYWHKIADHYFYCSDDSTLERLSPPLLLRFFCHDKSNYDFANCFFRPLNSSLSDFKCLTWALLFLAHSHQSNIVVLILDADACTVSNCKAIYSDSHQDKIHYLCRRGLHLQTL